MNASRVFRRRRLLALAGTGLAAFGLGFATRRLSGPGSAQAPDRFVDWQTAFQRKSAGGTARVLALVGGAQVARRGLALGDAVPSGQRVLVAPDGHLWVALPDGTVLDLRGGTEIALHFDQNSGGVYRLFAGAVLAVVPEQHLYLSVGPAGTVGVRGTAFYREVLPGNGGRLLSLEGERPVPEGARDYFCVCQGAADVLGDANRGEVLRHIDATHHQPYFLPEAGGSTLQAAPLLNHFDDEIARIVELMPGTKPDTHWLDPQGTARPRS